MIPSQMTQSKSVAVRPGERTGPRAILAIVRDSSNSTLLQCLDELLSDEVLLARVAKRSYRHQLGFLKFLLVADDYGCSVRLHHWDSPNLKHEDIHSHCAHFQSRVVLGRLSENAYSLCPGESHALFRYRFEELAGHSVAVACGSARALLREQRTLTRGDSYRKRASDLHNVSDAEHGTVTVSAWGRRHCEALVLKPLGTRAEDCAASSGMPVPAVRMALQDIRKRLGS